jgi:hypothetical protein
LTLSDASGSFHAQNPPVPAAGAPDELFQLNPPSVVYFIPPAADGRYTILFLSDAEQYTLPLFPGDDLCSQDTPPFAETWNL